MIGVIPNPRKSTIVNFPIERVKQSLDNVHLVSNKYKLEKSNAAFHQYSFSASEFLSMGAYIDVDLNEIDSNKTEIVIEAKRKIGAFDKAHEVGLANMHIDNMFNFLGKLTSGSIENLRADKKIADAKAFIDSKWYNSALWMFLASLFLWPVGLYGVSKTNRSTTFKIVFGILCALYAYFWIIAIIK